MTERIKTVITWPVTGVIIGVISAILAIIFNYIPAGKTELNAASDNFRIDIIENKVNACKTEISDVMTELQDLKNQNKIILKYVLKLNGYNE